MNTDDRRYDWLTEKIIGAAFVVGNVLGFGFLEKVYENALAHELRKLGLRVEQRARIEVWYDGIVVGVYVADLIVEGVVMIELKAAKGLDDAHVAQCINFVTAARLPICLLINFGREVEVRRIAGPTLCS
jgi:GxxExxY protein